MSVTERSLSQRRNGELSLLIVSLGEVAVDDADAAAAGQRAIRALAVLLFGLVRRSDLIGRHGPMSLGLLAPDTGSAGAQVLARRIARDLPASAELRDEVLHLDVAVGVATWPAEGTSIPELVERAEQQLTTRRPIAPPPGAQRAHQRPGLLLLVPVAAVLALLVIAVVVLAGQRGRHESPSAATMVPLVATAAASLPTTMATSTPAPAIDAFTVCDTVFSCNHTNFVAIDSVVACYHAQAAAPATVIEVIVTPAGTTPNGRSDPGAVARSAEQAAGTSATCVLARVTHAPLPVGAYTAWLFSGNVALAHLDFQTIARSPTPVR